VFLRNLRETQPGAAVEHYLIAVNIQPRTPDLPTFQLCTTHACFDALDDYAAFEFRRQCSTRRRTALAVRTPMINRLEIMEKSIILRRWNLVSAVRARRCQ
jgi:hypothetical protein